MSADAANRGGGPAPLPVPPLPVTVISGYLGAGKTTLVNRLLTEAHGRRITVLVNDFGEIPLDESLIVNRDGATLSLANGCMCCAIGGDLFDALDHWDDHLATRRYMVGDQLTLADVCMFTTLVRFDPVYYVHFKTNRQLISEYPNLSGYVRDIYQTPGVAETVNLFHIKEHSYRAHSQLNPKGFVPLGPAIDLDAPHGRGELG